MFPGTWNISCMALHEYGSKCLIWYAKAKAFVHYPYAACLAQLSTLVWRRALQLTCYSCHRIKCRENRWLGLGAWNRWQMEQRKTRRGKKYMVSLERSFHWLCVRMTEQLVMRNRSWLRHGRRIIKAVLAHMHCSHRLPGKILIVLVHN